MFRRKPIGLAINLRGLLNNMSSLDFDIDGTSAAISKAIDDLRIKYAREALAKYDASKFQKVNNELPDATYVIKPPENIIKNQPKEHKKYLGNSSAFVNNIYDSYYRAVRPGAASDEDAKRQARYLTQKAAFETGYGKHLANTHNYGGHKTKQGWVAFNSMDDFTRKDVALLDKKWSNWRNAKTEGEYIDAINTNNGYGQYAPPNENTNYKGRYVGMTKRINDMLVNRKSLKYGCNINRPKAFWGAVIGAATNILGSAMGAASQADAIAIQRKREEEEAARKSAKSYSDMLNSSRDYNEAYVRQFRMPYKKGGRRRLREGVTITDGGQFINSSTGKLYGPGDKLPVGTYDVLDYTHDEYNPSGNTGNGMKAGDKEIEVEQNERVKVRPNSVLVLSNSLEIPTPYGVDTPANASRNGVDNTYVERIQQNMNGNYNGDDTRKAIRKLSNRGKTSPRAMDMYMKNGGIVSLPVERIKAVDGIVYYDKDGKPYKEKRIKNPDGSVSFKLEYLPPNYTRSYALGNNSRRYTYAETVGNNPAPYKYMQIGSKVPTLEVYKAPDLSEDIDNYFAINNIDANKNNTTGVVSNGSVTSNKTNTKVNNNNNTNDEFILKPRTLSSPIGPEYYNPDVEITKPNTSDTIAPDKNKNINVDYNSGMEMPNTAGAGFMVNAAGSILSTMLGLMGNRGMDKTVAPALYTSSKLNTVYNIRPELNEIALTRSRMLSDANESSSSVGRLQRRNLINSSLLSATNKLWQTKTNEENNMLNADALNQQEIRNKNVEEYNRFEREQLNNLLDKRRADTNVILNGINGIAGAANDYIDQKREDWNGYQTMLLYGSLLPEEGRSWLARNGVYPFANGRMRLRNR